jgi:antitoxin ParD1/3/4
MNPGVTELAIINITVPDQMRQFVEERIGEGEFNTPSEYVRELIRTDQQRRAEHKLEAMLLRGQESPATEWTRKDAESIKEAVRVRLAAKQSTE